MDGQRISLSPARRLVADFLHFATRTPTVPVQRRMDLSALAEARNLRPDRIPWTALFLKAFALVARDMPELRRAYLKLPWHHLYEWKKSVSLIAVEREWRGERVVLLGRLRAPEEQSLDRIGACLQELRNAPVESVDTYRRALRLARWPKPLRRAALWLGLNLASRKARHFGTFGISVYSALGAESLHPIGPVTTMLNYGVFSPDGSVDVRMVYDHRVMDGATVARALKRLEEVLNGPVRVELGGADRFQRVN